MPRPGLRSFGSDPRYVTGIVSAGHFFSHFYILVFAPLFPLLLRDFPVSNAQLGAIVSVIFLSMFLFQTPVGFIVDSVGAKRVFVAGLVITAGGVTLTGLAPSYPLLLAGAFVSGVGQAAFHPADYALLGAVTQRKNEGKSFGVHLFAGFVGFTVAPIPMVALAGWFGWQTALVIASTFGLAFSLIAHLTLDPVYHRQVTMNEESRPRSLGWREDARALLDGRIISLFCLYVAVTMAGTGIQTFTPVLLVTQFGLSEYVGNFSLTVYFAVSAVGVLLGGAIVDWYDPIRLLLAALIGGGVVTVLAITDVMTVFAGVVVVFAGIGLLYGLALPARDKLVSAFSSVDSAGKSYGFVYTGLPLGGFIAPLVVGVTIDRVDPLAAFVVIGGFFFLSAGVAVVLRVVLATPTGSA